jgi:DNA-binding response OmpR family regulator
MSGYTEDNATRRDILSRGSSFLQKPFSVAELTAAVKQALESSAMLAHV